MPARVQVHSLLLQVRVPYSTCTHGARGVCRVAHFDSRCLAEQRLHLNRTDQLLSVRALQVRCTPRNAVAAHAPAFATHLTCLAHAGSPEPVRCTGHPRRGQPERPAVPGAAEVRASSLHGTPICGVSLRVAGASLRTMTNLKEAQCYRLFDMLDLDKSGATWPSVCWHHFTRD